MNAHAAKIDRVLELLRQLPPRERLRVMVEVLPELAHDLPDTTPGSDFWEGYDLRTLARQQNIQPMKDFDAFLGSWPAEEPIEDFIVALREWRKQNPAETRL